jgi:hypothetical protein
VVTGVAETPSSRETRLFRMLPHRFVECPFAHWFEGVRRCVDSSSLSPDVSHV